MPKVILQLCMHSYLLGLDEETFGWIFNLCHYNGCMNSEGSDVTAHMSALICAFTACIRDKGQHLI